MSRPFAFGATFPQADKTILRGRVDELEDRVARLQLLTQALWELVRDRFEVADEDLMELAYEIDVRDGVVDILLSQGVALG